MKRYLPIYLCLFCMIQSITSGAQELRMLVGTYTEDSSSEGVYLYSFNEEDASFDLLSQVASPNPSFVVIAPGARYAYSVNEYNDGRQGVSSYSIRDDRLTLLNSQTTDFGEIGGEDPCNLLLLGESLISSNYTGGTVSVFPVEQTGTLSPAQQCYSYREVKTVKLPWVSKKKGIVSHMHCAVTSPDGKYVFVTNLGADCIHRFKVSEGEEPLQDDGIAFQYKRRRQAGPRHMTFSKDGRFAYLICELDDILTVFSYSDGNLSEVQTISAYSGKGHGSADIHLSPDGRVLYTSHRLKEDGISIFSVDKVTGKVKNLGYQATGIHPRNFALTPNGKYLLCACRDSDAIEIYEISRSGLLKKTEKEIRLGKPVCIQFF